MPIFVSGLPASEVHTRLKDALVELQQAEKNALLWFSEIARRKLYRELGFSSLQMYATEALGFSKSKTAQFTRLAGVMEELPVLREAVTSGELTWTKAREVAKVASPKTEGQWVEKARRSSSRQLEKKVRKARARAKARPKGGQQVLDIQAGGKEEIEVPVSVNLRFSPEEFARWEAMLEKIRKQSGGCDRPEQLVLAALADLAEGPEKQPGRTKSTRVHSASPCQIVIYQCGTCKRAHVATSRGEQRLSKATLEAALCDAQIQEPGKRNRSTIPPAKRRQALIRAKHRCQMPGCQHWHFLEVHHRVPRERGGGNDLDNLVVLCSSCHRLLHERPDREGLLSREAGRAGGNMMSMDVLSGSRPAD